MAKKCKECKTKIENPYNSTQVACSPLCAIALARKAKAKEDKKKHKELKEKIKTKGKWLQEAQQEFNKYIRKRDEGNPCISCGRSTGCKVNAGHYRSVGACPELRFEEDNVHLQCEHCNCFRSGNAIDYRIGLIRKIGVERVEWLEGPHEPKKYTVEQIKEIKEAYRRKLKTVE